MADYVLPDVVEKRVRFFDGQFLQDQDFVDEQKYQLDREHRHNRLLHGAGIADGLAVTAGDPNKVTVAPGTAIDSDGHQLVLAQATAVDLPAENFNDKQGIELYLSYRESTEDPQTVAGSADFTRWLERPQLTAVAPGEAFQGTAPPVLLAKVALDHSGRVAVDATVRSYAGLRLPGPGADAASLHAASSGPVELAGSLTVDGSLGVGTMTPGVKLEVAGAGGMAIDLLVNGRLRSNNNDGGLWVAEDRFVGGHDANQIGFWNGSAWRLTVLSDGNVGIGTTSPANDLEIGAFESQNRYLALKVAGGNAYRAGVKLWTWQENYGFSIENDERLATGNGLHVRTHAQNADGTTRLFVGWNGNVGISTVTPANDLEIGAFESQDRYLALKVAGGNAHRAGVKLWTWQENYGYSIEYDERLATGNGLHVRNHNQNADGTTRLFVGWDGNVGIGTTTPGAKLEVAGGGGGSVDLVVNGRLRSNNNDGGLWVAEDRFVGGLNTNQIGFWNGNAWRLTVQNDGNVGIGTTSPAATLDVAGSAWVRGDLFVSGRLVYWWGPDGAWKQVQNRAGDWAGSYTTGGPSDIRLKADLRPIRHALDKVRQLHGIRYRWGDTGLSHFTRDIASTVSAGPGATDEQNHHIWQAERQKALEALAGDRLGLIAQEVETVLPELVHEDEDGYKHIRYQHLTALLIEAIKEQDAVVQALSARVSTVQTGQAG